MRLIADKKVAERREAVLVRRLAVALASTGSGHRSSTLKLLTKWGGPLNNKQTDD